MVIGIGTDIISIERIAGIIERQGQRFAERILTKNELKTYKKRKEAPAYLASRFAAKEAVAKALGTGIGKISFHDMETSHLPGGAPIVTLSGPAKIIQEEKNIKQVSISLSDEDKYAIAFVILSA